MSRTNPVIFVVGPTGTGKSALAMDLAGRFDGVILNGDSLQVYQRLDIGTAKPTPQERSRIPHFLFDAVSPGGSLTAGDYRRLALEVLQNQIPRHSVFVVGGSGFYLQALEKGMFAVAKPDPEIEAQARAELDDKGLAFLYEELRLHDPETAERLSPNDAYRILRAIVILRETGEKPSRLRDDFKPEPLPYPVLKLGLNFDRDALLPRIQSRTQAMLDRGLLAEVKALVDEGWGNWPALRSVGYNECLSVLEGRLPEEKLLEKICEKTMQLAKKQRTWFKRDREIHWLEASDSFNSACAIIARFLDTPA